MRGGAQDMDSTAGTGSPLGCRFDPGLPQDVPYRGRGHLHPEHEQSAMRPTVAPVGIPLARRRAARGSSARCAAGRRAWAGTGRRVGGRSGRGAGAGPCPAGPAVASGVVPRGARRGATPPGTSGRSRASGPAARSSAAPGRQPDDVGPTPVGSPRPASDTPCTRGVRRSCGCGRAAPRSPGCCHRPPVADRTTCNSCGVSRSRTFSAVAFAAVVTSPAARSSIRTRPTQGAACSRSKKLQGRPQHRAGVAAPPYQCAMISTGYR